MKTLLALAVAVFTTAAFAENDGHLIIEIPSSVQATIAREKGDNGKVRDFKTVNEGDGTAYLVGLTLEGKNYVLALDSAGQLLRKELDVENHGPRQVRLEAIPVKVRATLQREAGAATINDVELQEQKPTYVTEIKIGKRKYRLEVDAEGTLLKKEYTGDDDEK